MSNTQNTSKIYQIRLQGHLGPQWIDWFETMTITLEDNGDTLLTGPVVDQSALHGLLRKVRDVGIPLLSVIRLDADSKHIIQNKEKLTMSTHQKPMTLVIGGKGKTGRRVAERLEAKGLPVRIGSRSATPPFDWNDQRTWEPALENVKAVYVTYTPDLAVPEAPPAITAFSALAAKKGVERLVLLSGRGEPEAQRCEQIALNSGVDTTVVRASWFNQNFNEGAFLDLVRGGVVALPAGPVGEPFIDADDIADVAVAALTEDGHAGQIYEVTGPRLMTFTDVVSEIAKVSGREMQYQQISVEDFTAGMAAQNVPEEYISVLTYLFTTVLDGRNAYVADGVQRALGRPPRDFREYAQAAASAWQ